MARARRLDENLGLGNTPLGCGVRPRNAKVDHDEPRTSWETAALPKARGALCAPPRLSRCLLGCRVWVFATIAGALFAGLQYLLAPADPRQNFALELDRIRCCRMRDHPPPPPWAADIA